MRMRLPCPENGQQGRPTGHAVAYRFLAGVHGAPWGRIGEPLDLALDITQLTRDDLFYCKNKRRIDDAVRGFRERAGALCGGHQRRMA